MNGVANVAGRVFVLGGPSNVLPASPYEIVKSGQYRKDLSVLTGATKHDANFITIIFYDLLETKGLLNNAEFIRRDLIPMVARMFGE